MDNVQRNYYRYYNYYNYYTTILLLSTTMLAPPLGTPLQNFNMPELQRPRDDNYGVYTGTCLARCVLKKKRMQQWNS